MHNNWVSKYIHDHEQESSAYNNYTQEKDMYHDVPSTFGRAEITKEDESGREMNKNITQTMTIKLQI